MAKAAVKRSAKASSDDFQREIIDFDSEGPVGQSFFAFSTAAAPPGCQAANGHDPIDSALNNVTFSPPRYRWPNGALYLLRDIYCPNNR